MMHEETLPLLLKQLRLMVFHRRWEEISEQAQREGWSYGQFLKTLCDAQVSERYQKRLARYIKESKLPPGKTLDLFDFNAAENIDNKKITAYAESSMWVKEAKNLIFFGPSGVGKTHLAAGIAYQMINEGLRCLYYPATKLVQELQKAKQKYALSSELARLARYPLLIIDDIGYVKKTEMESSVLFEVIADRYESGSIIITANQPFGEWDSIFPDSVMTVAAIDRLIHHADIINIEAQSYRKTHALTGGLSF